MRINYRFDGYDYEYEVDNKDYVNTVYKLLKQETKESLIEIIMCSDMCQLDLSDMLADELKAYFEDKAYKEYLDGRYE